MPMPQQSEVEAVLQRWEPALLGVIRGAWADWKADPRAGQYLYARTRAAIVFEHMVRRTKEAFAGDPAVHEIPGHETCAFMIEERLVIRLKKGDERGMTSNIGTQLALAFHDHDNNLFGWPPVARVDIAYVLNPLQTEIRAVLVVARDGDRIVWAYDLVRRAGGALTDLGMPVDPIAPRPSHSLVRLRDENAGRRSAGEIGNRD